MTLNTFKKVKMGIAGLIGILLGISIVRQSYALALVTVLLAMAVLIIVRRQVKEVIEDERDYMTAGKAARTAVGIFSSLACIVAIALLYRRDANPQFELIGSILAYATCSLLLIYSVAFQFFDNASTKGRRILYSALALVLTFSFFAAGVRLFSGEDTWLCQDGQWVSHGAPEAPMPTEPCK